MRNPHRLLDVFGCLALLVAVPLSAAEHRVEKLNEAAPKEGISKEIAATLSPTGVRVIRGTSRTVCDIWLCKQWDLKTLKAEGEILYPFQPGQLIGVVRYPRRGSDFRDQQVDKGVYTLRYGHQPVDGNHVGTSVTRDFVMLVAVDKDKKPALFAYKPLVERSSEASDSGHPALLSLQEVSGGKDQVPSIRHMDEMDWWIVRLQGKAKLKDKLQPIKLDLVVVGHASE